LQKDATKDAGADGAAKDASGDAAGASGSGNGTASKAAVQEDTECGSVFELKFINPETLEEIEVKDLEEEIEIEMTGPCRKGKKVKSAYLNKGNE